MPTVQTQIIRRVRQEHQTGEAHQPIMACRNQIPLGTPRTERGSKTTTPTLLNSITLRGVVSHRLETVATGATGFHLMS